MSLQEWAKKHLHTKKSSSQDEDSREPDPPLQPATFKVYLSDSHGTTPLDVPEDGESHRDDKSDKSRSSSPISRSHSPKPHRKSFLSSRHGRSTSQNSLPEWNPPDESDPNAERDWEERAVELAKVRPISFSASHENLADLAKLSLQPESSSEPVETGWRDASSEEELQEGIRLHESGGCSLKSIL
jgi:hypothetical protein